MLASGRAFHYRFSTRVRTDMGLKIGEYALFKTWAPSVQRSAIELILHPGGSDDGPARVSDVLRTS